MVNEKAKQMFVIARKSDKSLLRSSYSKTKFAYRAVAVRKAKEFQSKLGEKFFVMEATEYEAKYGKQTKIVRNLMNGKEIEININTPRSCDPSSELYWSM